MKDLYVIIHDNIKIRQETPMNDNVKKQKVTLRVIDIYDYATNHIVKDIGEVYGCLNSHAESKNFSMLEMWLDLPECTIKRVELNIE